MKKSVKALSVILILAALFGLVGGGITFGDVMDCKAYWEAKGEESDANLAKLEEGLNTLKENEAAYLEGREAYETGLKDYEAGKKQIEDGQKEYDAGVQTLKEKQAEYDAGLAKLQAAKTQLAEGQAKYDAGAAALTQAGTLLNGLSSINSGYANWKAGYEGLLGFQALVAKSGTSLPSPSADPAVIAAYDAAIDTTKASLEAGIGYHNQLEQLQAQKTQLEAAIKATEAAGGDASQLIAQLAQVNTGIETLSAALAGKPSKAEMEVSLQGVSQLAGVPAALAQGQQELAAGTAAAVNGILSNEELAAKVTAASGMDAAALSAAVAALPGMDYPTFNGTMTQLTGLANGLVGGNDGLQAQYDAGKAELDAAKKALDAGYAEYNAGKAKLDDGAVQLAEGKKTLEEAGKTLAEGKKTLEAAEKQLSEGKAKLDEFESGREQVIAGLETLKGTETYAGLVSIAERLGEDFSYMKNDTDLDMEKGLEAVAVGREFSGENGAAVTRELTNRAIAAALALLGSVLALAAGIMGLAGKAKGSGVLAVIAALAAGAAVAAALMAGTELSAAAGSTTGPLALAAGGVLTAASIAQAIAALAPSKTAA